MWVDLSMVIISYALMAFVAEVAIDGYLLPPFNPTIAATRPSIILFLEICGQILFQTLLAIGAHWVVEHMPCPVQGLGGYDAKGPFSQGSLRNPALFTVIVFSLSASLQARIKFLFGRYDPHASQTAALAVKIPPAL
jgi:hypothetical protein